MSDFMVYLCLVAIVCHWICDEVNDAKTKDKLDAILEELKRK